MTQTAQALKDRTAVCGVGLKIGSFPDHTALQLAVETFQVALDDAGMQRKDVGGLMMLSMGPAKDSSCQRPPRLNAVPRNCTNDKRTTTPCETRRARNTGIGSVVRIAAGIRA